MIRSTDRILVTHQGTLPRPADVREMVLAKDGGKPVDEALLTRRLREAIADNVKHQLEVGIDSVNDGELSKSSFSNYARLRLGGVHEREIRPTDPPRRGVSQRDAQEFGGYFRGRSGFTGVVSGTIQQRIVCDAPLTYIGMETTQADIANFKAALAGIDGVQEAYLPAVAPGTIEHWLQNDYYPDSEKFLFALADAMHEEYKAIVEAGFLLQIDDPDLPDGYQMFPEFSVDDYRRYAELRVDALNHALRDIPSDRVRFHMCWGSYKGPHKYDLPLADIVDVMLKIKADAYSIEQSNPMHAHEWRVFEDVKLPAGKTLIPGVIGHASDFIESPELVADRLLNYAKLVGRENVMAGTDCGIGSRVGQPGIAWAKFQSMSRGAELASKQLWGR